jgi:hypothetical protein
MARRKVNSWSIVSIMAAAVEDAIVEAGLTKPLDIALFVNTQLREHGYTVTTTTATTTPKEPALRDHTRRLPELLDARIEREREQEARTKETLAALSAGLRKTLATATADSTTDNR